MISTSEMFDTLSNHSAGPQAAIAAAAKRTERAPGEGVDEPLGDDRE